MAWIAEWFSSDNLKKILKIVQDPCLLGGLILAATVAYYFINQGAGTDDSLVGGLVLMTLAASVTLCKWASKRWSHAGRWLARVGGLVLVVVVIAGMLTGCASDRDKQAFLPSGGADRGSIEKILAWNSTKQLATDIVISGAITHPLIGEPPDLPSPAAGGAKGSDVDDLGAKASIQETRIGFLLPDEEPGPDFGLYSYVVLRTLRPETSLTARTLMDAMLRLRHQGGAGAFDPSRFRQNGLFGLLRDHPTEMTADSILKHYDYDRSETIADLVEKNRKQSLSRWQQVLIITAPRPIETITPDDSILVTNFNRVPTDRVDWFFQSYLSTVKQPNFTQKDMMVEAEITMLNLGRAMGMSWKAAMKFTEFSKAMAAER